MQETSPLAIVMDKQEKQESLSPTPVLPRLDRLDRLLQFLEEKHNSSSRRHIVRTADQKVEENEDQHLKKTLSSALEEVQHKGTLLERLARLETRVLQLSLFMDEGNTSKSSSSTAADESQRKKQDENEVISAQGRKSPPGVQDGVSGTKCDMEKPPVQVDGRKQRKKAHRKWLRWLHLTCNVSHK